MAHHPGVGRLLLPLLDHVGVEVDQGEEVEAEGRGEAAEERAGEQEGVLVRLARGEVVENKVL